MKFGKTKGIKQSLQSLPWFPIHWKKKMKAEV